MNRTTLRWLGPAVLLLAAGCGPSRGGGGLCWVPPDDDHRTLWGYESDSDDRYNCVVFVRSPAPAADATPALAVGTNEFWFGESEEKPVLRVEYDESWWGSVRIAGRSYWLPNGRVFLCDVTGARPSVRQLRIHLPPYDDGLKTPDIGKHLAATDRRVAEFLGVGSTTAPSTNPSAEE